MPYKDESKQKEAIRKAVQKHRQGITEGITEEGITEGITEEGITTNNVIPRYDYELTVKEILTLHYRRLHDQVDRFPSIPLPFGQAYYEALAEHNRT